MAVGMSVQMLGLPQFLSELQHLTKSVHVNIERATYDSTIEALLVVQQLSPIRTGYFESRWDVRGPFRKSSAIWCELFNDASYAIPLIFGHHTQSGSWVEPQDCLTPAVLYGRKRLNRRLRGLLHSTIQGIQV